MAYSHPNPFTSGPPPSYDSPENYLPGYSTTGGGQTVYYNHYGDNRFSFRRPGTYDVTLNHTYQFRHTAGTSGTTGFTQTSARVIQASQNENRNLPSARPLSRAPALCYGGSRRSPQPGTSFGRTGQINLFTSPPTMIHTRKGGLRGLSSVATSGSTDRAPNHSFGTSDSSGFFGEFTSTDDDGVDDVFSALYPL